MAYCCWVGWLQLVQTGANYLRALAEANALGTSKGSASCAEAWGLSRAVRITIFPDLEEKQGEYKETWAPWKKHP